MIVNLYPGVLEVGLGGFSFFTLKEIFIPEKYNCAKILKKNLTIPLSDAMIIPFTF